MPVDDMILKIAEGNPQGRLSAKKTFEYFSSFEKYFVVPWNGIETRQGWQAQRTRQSGTPEQQDRATSEENKAEEKAKATSKEHKTEEKAKTTSKEHKTEEKAKTTSKENNQEQ